ncbi:ChrR family anti-sigma-E factor [Vibrio sp. TRT 17S01]|uniref:ChrR family anti-sigma-E factor n=1 Tax=Vibrio sp. TRT 17S01 TaxID=3418505 RepID=UPI003CFA1260
MNHHPDKHLLQAYAEGSIDAANGFAIAIHLETCPQCKAIVAQAEESLAKQSLSLDSGLKSELDCSFDNMLSQITALPQEEVGRVLLESPPEVEVNGKSFHLPRALSRFTDQLGSWRSYGGRVYSSTIDIGEKARVSLLYIGEEVQIPHHTHKGVESTLILHGGFSDEDGHYEAGDFIVRDTRTVHSPYTNVGEDCLCLAILTEPMLFTQGVARIFNRFGKGMYP